MPGKDVKTVSSIDELYEIDASYTRFDQKYEMFARSCWDESLTYKSLRDIKKYIGKCVAENLPGFTLRDYALMQGSWAVTNASEFETGNMGLLSWKPLSFERNPSSVQLFKMWREKNNDQFLGKFHGSPEELSLIVKKAAKTYGADLVGICELDHRWVYSHHLVRPNNAHKKIVFRDVDEPEETDEEFIIPSDINRAVVMGIEMDIDLLRSSPSPLCDAATGLGYSKMVFLAASLAEFIRGLGYKAIPCANDTALSIPLAISAGLGQIGRSGLLITPEFGPAVRICKVLTNMPLEIDRPIDFGVTEFCEKCKRCAESCPTQAISFGERTKERRTISNNPGVLKWPIDPEACLEAWKEIGVSCSNCIAVCPFNKVRGYKHLATEKGDAEEWWGLIET
ncbi:MAG: reductive dehalogenase [Candidatus Freyrarchaeum guaymaensis]|nr:reductive dehalogenase [Candidatus Sigynarchaeota archaeon]